MTEASAADTFRQRAPEPAGSWDALLAQGLSPPQLPALPGSPLREFRSRKAVDRIHHHR